MGTTQLEETEENFNKEQGTFYTLEKTDSAVKWSIQKHAYRLNWSEYYECKSNWHQANKKMNDRSALTTADTKKIIRTQSNGNTVPLRISPVSQNPDF